MIESLEARIAPAGIVTVDLTSPVLFLTGDGMDNDIQVTPLGGGAYLLEGKNGTLFNTNHPQIGNGIQFLPLYNLPLGGLQVNLGAGNDIFNSIGLKVGGVTNLVGGNGNDTFLLSDHLNLGPVTMTGGEGNDSLTLGGKYSIIRSKLTFEDSLGNNALAFQSMTATLASIQYNGGAGEDVILGTSRVFRASSLTANFGDGNGGIGFESGSVTFGGAINATFGNGNAQFGLVSETLSIASGVTVDLGLTGTSGVSEADLLFASSFSGRIGGTVKVMGGVGINELQFSGAEISIGGSVTFSPAGTENSLSVNGGAVKVSGDFVMNGTTGKDTVEIEAPQFTVAKKSVFNLGGGENTIAASVANATYSGGVQYSGGGGADSVSLIGGIRMGAFNAQFGSGADALNIKGPRVEISKMTVHSPNLVGDTFAAEVGGLELALKTSATFVSGAGTSSVILGFSEGEFSAGNDLIFTGGSGRDSILVQGSEVLIKNLKVDAGLGGSEVLLAGDQLTAAGVRFRGLNGTNSVTVFGGVGLVGLVDVTTLAGTSSLSVLSNFDLLRVAGINYNTANTGLDTSSLTLSKLMVAGRVNVNTGEGNDTIALGESTFRGSVLMQTNGGMDLVGVDTVDTSTFSIFRKAFSVTLGSGDDGLMVGNNTYGGHAVFLSTILIDAGNGNDGTDLLFQNGNYFAKLPVVNGSEASG